MSLHPLFKRLARKMWRDEASSRRSPRRPLRVLRLERRRVLSADFSLVGDALVIDGFEGANGETLTVAQNGDSYDFTVGSGGWEHASGEPPPDGVTIEGDTLSVDAALLGQLTEGVSIVGDAGTPLDVMFGEADFSAMPGALSIDGAASIGQESLALLSATTVELTAQPAGLTIGSLNVAGDFNVIGFGPITDAAGTEITVAGDATFTSLRRYPDADFDQSGVVDQADYDVWAANYGVASGATRADGDANGDGRVDTADYAVWRESLGETAVDGGVTLADNAGDVFTVDGVATFNAYDALDTAAAGERFDIAIGAENGGAVNFGSFSATGGDVSLYESSSTTLAGVDAENLSIDSAGDLDDDRDDGLGGSSATIVVAGDAGFDATGAVTLNDTAGETLTVGGKTTLAGATIAVGDAGLFNTGTLNFDSVGAVTIEEDSSTELAMVSNAGSLDLSSDGSLTDSSAASLVVSDDASLAAVADITLADDSDNLLVVGGKTSLVGDSIAVGDAGVFLTGTLNFNAPGAVTIEEDSSTELAMASTAGVLELSSDGSLTDAPGASVVVTGDATFTADTDITLSDDAADALTVAGKASFAGASITIGDAGAFNAGTLNFNSVGAVTIEEDSSTELAMASTAGVLELSSDGSLSDSADTLVDVEGDATLTAIGDIALTDDAADALLVGGKASFAGASITIGDAGGFHSETLNFNSPGAVTIQDDAVIVLAMNNTAETLQLTGAEISNDPSMTLAVVGDATLAAEGRIQLLGDVGDALTVGGKTSLVGTVIDIGDEGAFNTGTVTFNATDLVTIQEDSGTVLAMDSTAGTVILTSADRLTDEPGATVTVAGDATVTAGAMNLADNAADAINVGGKATFLGGTIVVFEAGEFNAGALNFVSTAGVFIQEDSSTELAMDNVAALLDLTSTGSITDAAGTSVVVSQDASFVAADAVVLNDDAADTLTVGGKASFAGASITVGDAGEFNTGQLSFNAPGAVTIEEDSSTDVAMDNTAGDLDLSSDGVLTDAATATLLVTGDAVLFADGGIVLADDDYAPNGNSIAVAGGAAFAVSDGGSIDIGVVSDGSADDGLPAAAIADFGSLQFTAVGGTVRLAEDSGVVLGGTSSANTVELLADGSITDAAGAATTIDGSAELTAVDSDVVLGDDGATFDMGAPDLFDATRYLAIDAVNVSVEVDSAVNVRTGADDAAYDGVYYLSATGSVTQVGDAAGVVTALTAERIAIDSDGAVLLSAVRLTSVVNDDSPANLAIHAGLPVDVSVLDGVNGGAFPVDLIPSDTVTELSPIDVEGGDADAEANGLTTLEGAEVETATPIGDGYSLVVLVEGNAKVGEVADATGAQANLVGLAVDAADGNAYLQTTVAGDLVFSAIAAAPGGADVADGVVVRMAGGVLTAVAAGVLRIDTANPDEDDPAARTTVLRSATGAVTSVDAFTTYDGQTDSVITLVGPRLVLDEADDDMAAATTDLVLSSTDFLQLVTLGVGSRGEDNLVLVIDWADVVDPLLADVPDERVALDPSTPGADLLPEIALVPVEIEANTPLDGLIQTSDPTIAYRVVTIGHRYNDGFIPANPLVDTLPTTVTLFNDPAINLFDRFVQTDNGAEFRQLNSNTVAYSASIRAVETGFSMPLPRAEASEIVAPEAPIAYDSSVTVQERLFVEESRAVVSASVEVILYGRVDPGDPELWATDVPGEDWPQEWKDADGDFLEDIREMIDEGPSSEGRYRIVVETSRGVQPLEEWVKGDVQAAEAAEPDAAAPADEHGVWLAPDETLDAVTPDAIDAAHRVVTAVEPPAAERPVAAVIGPVAGAAVAVGGWRRRFLLGDRIEFDQDGVGFTRAARRRRRVE